MSRWHQLILPSLLEDLGQNHGPAGVIPKSPEFSRLLFKLKASVLGVGRPRARSISVVWGFQEKKKGSADAVERGSKMLWGMPPGFMCLFQVSEGARWTKMSF